MIDTLVLSGGGLNCSLILGCIKYLIDIGMINSDFKNIKNIICVSGSAFFILPFLLGYSYNACLKICVNINNDQIINMNELSLNTLIKEYGFFSNDFLNKIIHSFLIKKGFKENATLKELYDFSKINFVIKTSNITQNKIEYINHLSHPDIPIKQIIQMTTCVPFVFKPIKFNNDFYLDGGVCGNFPIEYIRKLKIKNYFAINIRNKFVHKEINSIFDYLSTISRLPFSSTDIIKNNKKIITIECETDGISDILQNKIDKNHKMKLITYGYNEISKHFKKYYKQVD
tara:strand:- start:1916 stop:2773 length:858 start_codon:yes stop_codon:yes gene_type:complete